MEYTGLGSSSISGLEDDPERTGEICPLLPEERSPLHDIQLNIKGKERQKINVRIPVTVSGFMAGIFDLKITEFTVRKYLQIAGSINLNFSRLIN
jgi:hypothetical protein